MSYIDVPPLPPIDFITKVRRIDGKLICPFCNIMSLDFMAVDVISHSGLAERSTILLPDNPQSTWTTKDEAGTVHWFKCPDDNCSDYFICLHMDQNGRQRWTKTTPV